MSQDHKVLPLVAKKKINMTDRDKLVYAYHYFENQSEDKAKELLSSVSGHYYQSGLHKDISRALLCHATYPTHKNDDLGKESEFFVVIKRLTTIVVDNKIHFNGSGHFHTLKSELFKGFM